MDSETDMWGFCGGCGRWFYCEAGSHEATPTCPVCTSDPLAVKNWAASPSTEAEPGAGEVSSPEPLFRISDS